MQCRTRASKPLLRGYDRSAQESAPHERPSIGAIKLNPFSNAVNRRQNLPRKVKNLAVFPLKKWKRFLELQILNTLSGGTVKNLSQHLHKRCQIPSMKFRETFIQI